MAVLVEQSDAFRGFPRFDDELDRPRIEPALALRDELVDDVRPERAVMLLAELELHFETAFLGHVDHGSRPEWHLGEAFASLDPGHADIGAEVEIGRQLTLGDGDLERRAAGNGRHAIALGRSDLAARR